MIVQPPSRKTTRQAALYLTIAVLLVAVVGLATLAKNGQYFPNANPVHQVSVSIKLNVSAARAAVAPAEVQPVTRFTPPIPVVTARFEPVEAPPVQQLSVTLSIQHRSPPLS